MGFGYSSFSLPCYSDAHRSLIQSTSSLVYNHPAKISSLVRDIFSHYALPSHLIDSLSHHVTSLPANLQVEFIMHFHHRSSMEQSDRAIWSAVTIALGYFFGGAVPLLPYVLAGKDSTISTAFWRSCFLMAVALFAFGAIKTRLLFDKPQQWEGTYVPQETILSFSKQDIKQYFRGGMEMIVLGGFAAGAAMSIIKLIEE
jgi:hypothetical protein